MLQNYSWPGNIRELENCIERAVILCHGTTILPKHLLFSDEEAPVASPHPRRSTACDPLSDIEREYIQYVLGECGNNQSRAASVLGIDRKTLRNKIREYELGTEIAVPDPDHEPTTHR